MSFIRSVVGNSRVRKLLFTMALMTGLHFYFVTLDESLSPRLAYGQTSSTEKENQVIQDSVKLNAIKHLKDTSSTLTKSVKISDSLQKSKQGGIKSWLPKNSEEIRKAVLTAVLSVLGTLFIIFFKKIVSCVEVLLRWIWSRIKVERAVEARYRSKTAKSLRSIQILEMSEAKNLETFYIPLKLANWVAPNLKNIDQAHAQLVSLNDALKTYEQITILGPPGSGKTTITSHFAAAVADRNLKIDGKKFFPIYVPLRRLKEFLENEKHQNDSLRELISSSLERFNFPDIDKFIERKLRDGQCLLVLDGFDELSDREGLLQKRLANKIDDFVSSISVGNRVVLTSRTPGYEPAWFQNFRVFEITELPIEQVKLFISGWYCDSKDYSDSLKFILDCNERLQLLVTNPLMLAIVCFVYGSKKPEENFLPQRRVDLYERCIDALIADWDRSRGIDREPKFTPKQIKVVLQGAAYEALVDEKIDFSKKQLLALLRTYMPDAALPQYDNETFLKEVLEHTGLFKEKAYDTFGFLHLTFQEYLASLVIAQRVLIGFEEKDVRSKIRDVINNVANPRWNEPIALAAGVLRGRTELVSTLYEEYKKHPTAEFSVLLGACLRDADLEDFSYDPDYLITQDDILSSIVDTASHEGT